MTLSQEIIDKHKMDAANGHPDAQYKLGLMYLWGKGVDQNFPQAIAWFKKSAEQSNIEACFHLGFLFYKGDHVAIDFKQSFDYFLCAAETGHPISCNFIGKYYQIGLETEKDLSKAIYWYEKSSEKDNINAQFELGRIYKGMDGQSNQRKAFSWFLRAAEKGDAESQYEVSMMYKTGSGVNPDETLYYSWLEKSANQNYRMAQWELELLNQKNPDNDKPSVLNDEFYQSLIDDTNELYNKKVED